MNAGKLFVSAVMTGVFLWGAASAETPAPKPIGAYSTHNPAMEEHPEKLRAFSCETLDNAMATNYITTATLDSVQLINPNPNTKAIAAPIVKRFQAERKEYKSRCKGKAKQLDEAKKRFPTNSFLPNA